MATLGTTTPAPRGGDGPARRRRSTARGAVLAAGLLACAAGRAGDWPMRLHDAGRSGVASEALSVPLSPDWTHSTKRRPAPAWTESPARHDYLHKWYDLKPRQGFDRCFDVAVAADRVYFGSSSSGAVTCLLAGESGKVAWTFFTDAPVRFAPQVVGERLYVGSDDGHAYCLNARDGSLVWKERAGATAEMLWGNEHMISLWPVRTSPLVHGENVFWTAGLFPEEGIYVCRRKAADGSGGWTHSLPRPAQGYLLATAEHLIVPTGKTFPLVCDLNSGKLVGDLKDSARDGGSWALVEPGTGRVWSGPTVTNALQGLGGGRGARKASLAGANCLVVDGDDAFYSTDSRVVRVESAGGTTVWSRKASYPHSLIKAGAVVFVGGDGEVAAFSADGDQLWQAPVDGKAFGLAVAGGRLYVSTDAGSIHCFRATLPHLVGPGQATRVGADSADIVGRLGSAGGAPTSVSLHWGESDGGTAPDGWEHSVQLGECPAGPLAAKVGPLRPDRTFYVRFAATNSFGTSRAETAGTFTTSEVVLSTDDPSASEAGLDPAAFTVSRSVQDTKTALTVRYTVSGTADAGGDFSSLSGQVVIPAGSSSGTIVVTPLDDLLLDEPEETVVVTLSPGAYRIGAANRASVTISDRESMAGWQHKARLVATGYREGEGLTGFPALLLLGGDAVPGFRQEQLTDNRADLRFTDADVTTLLPYEVEAWDADGHARVWVRIPELTAGETGIWVWWGNPACRVPPSYTADGSVWSPDYVAVWHLGGADGPVRDATPSRNHGDARDVRRAAPGVVGDAVAFDGAKGTIELTSILPIGGTDNTLSAWINVPKVGTEGLGAKERVGILLGNFADTPNANWELHATGETRWHWNNGKPDRRGTTDLRDARWHHLAWTRDRGADKLSVYVDGKLEKAFSQAGADIAFTTRHAIGADNRGKGTPRFHGRVDELRISRVARSADWIRACFANQSSPATFWSCKQPNTP